MPLRERRRWTLPLTAGVAAAGACAAVALGLWAVSLSSYLAEERAALDEREQVVAGVFPGGGPRTIVKLTRPVPQGAAVAVTIERAGGVEQPEGAPVFTTARPA